MPYIIEKRHLSALCLIGANDRQTPDCIELPDLIELEFISMHVF
jgi:hypothetical protein